MSKPIDWQVLECLMPVGYDQYERRELKIENEKDVLMYDIPLVTENNAIFYCNYYSRDEKWNELHKLGYVNINFVTTAKTDMFFVVGYKK